METFARPRPFVDNPRYDRDRELMLASLDLKAIDAPLRPLIEGFTHLPTCFTLQCCYGHFVHSGQPHTENLEPVPEHDVGPITYRIAYIAFCLENSDGGKRLRAALEEVTAIDPENVQFGSPDWFWQQYLNSYALQVEPARFANSDRAILEHHEALHVQQVRDQFFGRLNEVVEALQQEVGKT